MRWQFGGNLQPVRMICEFDWRECPSALINYAWSEIVTDVVECLTNESIMWRVIAMLLVCSLLVHAIYSKARWIDETTTNRENLNIVGAKIQDLELKVNILTYKMQYGNWPLPKQIRGTIVEGQIANQQPLTLTDSNERNNWLKRILLSSPAENAACVRYAKIGPRSIRCLTKLINLETKYSRESGGNEKAVKYEELLKPRVAEKQIANSQSLQIESKYSSPKNPKNSWSETRVSEILSCRENYRENNLKVAKKFSPSKVGTYSEDRKSYPRLPSRLEFNFDKLVDKSPEERVNSTQETLQRVTQKLQDLHSVLRIYGNPNCARNTREEESSNKEMAETILRELKSLGNLPTTESESDGLKNGNDVVKLMDSNNEENNETSEFEQCQSDRSSTSIRTNENTTEALLPSDEKHSEDEACGIKELDDAPDIAPIEANRPESSKVERALVSSEEEAPAVETEDEESTRVEGEYSRESNVEEESNSELFREAQTFKEALLSEIDLQRSDKPQAEVENREVDDKFNEQWPKVKSHLESKLLDIISEEQSGSSTDKQNSEYPTDSTSEKTANNDALVSQASEYFSLSNLEERMLAQRIASLTAKDTSESLSSSNSSDSEELAEKPETSKENDEKLQKNISDLVNQSVQNIREYIQVFSRMQNDAIVETRKAIDENSSPNLKDCSSEDSIMHFVNAVNIVDSRSEELPKELPEAAIDSLVDLAGEISEEEKDVEFSLKRRPGFMSLESNRSENGSSTEPSCKQLVMDYLPETSDSDLTDDKLNLIEFEDEIGSRDEKITAESPLTGRTVIRATSSSLNKLEKGELSGATRTEKPESRESRERIEKKSTANLSSDTSGTYMDAGSKTFDPSDISLCLGNKMTKSSEKCGLSKSASTSSSPLRQRIPWNAPKRGSSLNNATAKPKKPDVPRAKSVTSAGRGFNSGKEILTPGRIAREAKSSELADRRSRSFVTPRKIEASPRTKSTDKIGKNRESAKVAGNPKKVEKPDSGPKNAASRSCIPLLKRRIRAKSPARGPLTISTSSWQEERATGHPGTISVGEIVKSEEKALEKSTKSGENAADKSQEGRTVIYVNIATEKESSATRIVDPKKFLEYLKDRELKIQSVFDQENEPETIDAEKCSSPRILTVVSTAAVGERLSNAWSLRVEQKEIQVTAKPSVIDTSTSISDLPDITATNSNFEIFQTPKELTKQEYDLLLETLNRRPNLQKLREMHELCDKFGPEICD